MHRHNLFMLLAAFVFCGITTAVPGPIHAQESMIERAEIDRADADKAIMVFYNTDRLMRAYNAYAANKNARGPALSQPVLSQNDKALSHVYAAGPMLAQADSSGPALSGQEGDSPGSETPADSSDAADIPQDQEALYEEVRELRDMVDELREEAEARQQLRVTEEEERDEEEDILEAAGREYSIRPPWQFQLNLRMNYSYNDYDVIQQLQAQEGTRILHRSNHNFTNTFSLETGVRDNLSIDASIPFVYKYDKVDTPQSKDVNDLGDASVGLKYQPLKTGRGYPSPIFSVDYTFTTGRSPFEINPSTELSTGSGFNQVSGNVSVSQPVDPVNAFASLSYNHRFRETDIGQSRGRGTLDEVDPGDTVSASMGFGYAVSYRMSMSLSLSTSYRFSTDYYWLAREGREKTSSGDNVSASLTLNTSWRVTPGRTVIIGVGKGLTTANPGFTLSVRVPVSLDLR